MLPSGQRLPLGEIERTGVAPFMLQHQATIIVHSGDDDSGRAVVISRRDEALHHVLDLPTLELDLPALLAPLGLQRAMLTGISVSKQLQLIHQILRQIVGQKEDVVLLSADLKEFLAAGDPCFPLSIQVILPPFHLIAACLRLLAAFYYDCNIDGGFQAVC